MTNSTFYHDGYKARADGLPPSPPDFAVYANEYINGYRDACSELDDFTKPEEA